MKIVYHSFEGRYSDSPRVLYEALLAREPGHDHLWLADPAHAGGFPPHAATAPYASEAGVTALESADLVVANTHTDLAWTKRPDALYLQTWHGTPLKRIHFDVLWAPEGRLERLSGDVAQWDVLLSPNHVSTERLRGAFGYSGEVLESGYPRNDVLSRRDRDAVRARVRHELAIPEGKTAVLYTPTWRDDVVFAEGDGSFRLGLDVDAFTDRLGDDHVLLLRLHYMLTGRLEAYEHPAVRDVSFHPEVSELYLAADVLVTDYSSTMFDFAVTGKPLLFYTYDLEDYESRVRGFYFDLASIAPGPLVRTTEELLGALAELPRVTAEHADAYAHFRETFCHLDDGHASERVLDRVLRTQAPRPATAR
ncbi:MAG: CDP-glycerol glycerophosphotransferase family protein [Actinomycetota bacterium]|nr:CDP-glycerol glycerophosphotransferase family protein [Actinomycetota bacterium]